MYEVHQGMDDGTLQNKSRKQFSAYGSRSGEVTFWYSGCLHGFNFFIVRRIRRWSVGFRCGIHLRQLAGA